MLRRLQSSRILLFCALSLVSAACAKGTPKPAAAPAKAAPQAPRPSAKAPTPLPALAAAPPPEKGWLPPAGVRAAGPLSLEAVAPDARWLVVCQARADTDGDARVAVTTSAKGEPAGDRMARYLAFASGEEQMIDDLLASSADGRWLVLRIADHVELYDSVSGVRRDLTALGADTRSEPIEAGPHRAFAFTSDALVYVRARDALEELVWHKLEDGSERMLYSSPDPIARMRVDPAGKLAVLQVARPENAKNRRFVWPYRLENNARACRGPEAHYLAPNPNADLFSTLVVDIEQARGGLVDNLAGVWGAGIVRREADASLSFVRGSERLRVADKACAGRLLFVDPGGETLLVGCSIEKRPGRLNVELVTRAEHRSLDLEVALLGYDEPARAPQRLVALYPGADCVLFDTQKRTIHRLHTGDSVLSTFATRALIRRGKSLLFVDADTGTETALPVAPDAFGEVLVTRSLAFVSPWLIDLESGRVRGRVSGKGLALSALGAVLVPSVGPSDHSLAEGPLTWRLPE